MANWGVSPQDIKLRKMAKKAAIKQVEKIEKKHLEKLTNEYHLIWIWALRNKYEFGTKRINDILDKVGEIAQDITEGHISFDDIREALEDEIGLKL